MITSQLVRLCSDGGWSAGGVWQAVHGGHQPVRLPIPREGWDGGDVGKCVAPGEPAAPVPAPEVQQVRCRLEAAPLPTEPQW